MVERDRNDWQPVKRSNITRGSRRGRRLHDVPVLNVSSESSRALSSGASRASISTAGWRALRKHGSKSRGINPRPTAKFGVGLQTVVAGALARRKQPSLQGVADRLLVGGNAGSAKTSPSSVRNPDVWIRGRIIVGPHLGQSPMVDTGPVTDFSMCFCAVVRWPTVGVEFPGLESTDNDFLVDGNASVEKATVRPLRKAVWNQSGCHERKSVLCCSLKHSPISRK